MNGPGSALARARERFLDDGALDERAGVRPEIVDSWQRSRRGGVDASRLTVPYEADVDLRGRLVRCAAPVLDRLEEQLAGTAVAVVLTDPEGRLLDRRVGEDELRRRLDAISLAPGFRYAEEFAGTNGVGTALRGGAATLVVGAEHFTDRLQPFACAGAPIHHPTTGRLVGIVDVTCLRTQANDLMRVLALQAAHDVALVLGERGSVGARAVMAEFEAVCARSPYPVVAVGEGFALANRRAQADLRGADHDHVRRAADDVRASGAAPDRLLLEAGPIRVHPMPVTCAGRRAGVVLELVPDPLPAPSPPAASAVPAPRRPRPEPGPGRVRRDRGLAGLAGSSASWRSSCSALRDAAAGAAATVVLGEAGTGKAAAVRAAHGEVRPWARWVVAGGDGPGATTVRQTLTELERSGAENVTLLVPHLERLDAADADALAAVLRRVPPGRAWADGWWVVGLVTGEGVDAAEPAAGLPAAFPTSIVVEPLRRRSEDVPALVGALLARLAPSRRVRCTPAAQQLLAGGLWPGNAAELTEVLRRVLAAKPRGDIEPGDLPVEFAAHGTRRRLSPLEALERDAIVAALVDARGNRVQAAAALGMGRATLYRRLRAFGLTDVGR